MKKKKKTNNPDIWKDNNSSKKDEIIAVNTKNEAVRIETEELEKDIPIRQVIIFFSVLVAIFTLSFILKYIFPNVPEYVFERLLMVILALFCIYVLWNVSSEFKSFIEKHLPKVIADKINKCGNTMSDEQGH